MTNNPTDYNNEAYKRASIEYAEARERISKSFRVSYELTQDDIEDWPRAKVGDIIFKNPEIPNNPKDAFELFKNYYAQLHFEYEKCEFVKKYRIWNVASVKSEINEIEKWIAEANELSYKDALEGENRNWGKYEYLRLVNGYYDGYKMTWQEHHHASLASQVYGRIFIFYDYLKNKLAALLYQGKEERRDFSKWLFNQYNVYDWKEIAWQYNTGNAFQHKQDLAAIFWNSYIYIQQKFEPYFEEYKVIPTEVLQELIFKFRQSFPKEGRVEGVNYYDDLIEQLIDKYATKLTILNTKTDMKFYENIAHAIYTDNMVINETKFYVIEDYIEAMHEKAEYKGKVFYDNLYAEMYKHWGAKIKRQSFDLVLKYCIAKTEEKEAIIETKEPNSEFTTARQVLAMHYIFEYCQINNVDNTAKARFIQFLTGKETGAKTIKNTTIYKRVRSPFSEDDKSLIADLQYIRKYFEDLGFSKIAEAITKEINTKTK